MPKILTPLLLGLCLAATCDAQQDSLPGVFDHLGSNLGHSFSGGNLLLQTGAIAATYGIVQAGWDYDVHHYFHENPDVGLVGSPTAALGGVVPILLAGGLYTYGATSSQPEVVVAGHAVTQAVALAFTYHELLKAVTGRPAPRDVPESQMEYHSREFRFGLLRGGLFWGWPSGHLAANTAAVSALSAFYPDNNYLAAAKYAWISYMFYGVTSHGGASMHWFSDAVAGTMMGLAFGRTVGTSYHLRMHPAPAAAPTLVDRFSLFPTAIAGAPGLELEFRM